MGIRNAFERVYRIRIAPERFIHLAQEKPAARLETPVANVLEAHRKFVDGILKRTALYIQLAHRQAKARLPSV